MDGRVTSRDGTAIAYDRAGAGPAVILVGGGAADRSENAPLAAELAARFTVFNYDRRGRGASGDTLPYAVQREVEDIAALVAEAGGTVHLFGASSGGALALEAAAAGVALDRLAVYEVPYQVDDGWPARWRAYVDELTALLAADRRGDAFARFMRLAEIPEEAIAAAREAPFWPALEALAPTLAYDAACLGDGRPPTAASRWSRSPRWSPPASRRASRTPRRGSERSTRPRTRSWRACRAASAASSKARATSPTRRRSRPCSRGSSRLSSTGASGGDR